MRSARHVYTLGPDSLFSWSQVTERLAGRGDVRRGARGATVCGGDKAARLRPARGSRPRPAAPLLCVRPSPRPPPPARPARLSTAPRDLASSSPIPPTFEPRTPAHLSPAIY